MVLSALLWSNHNVYYSSSKTTQFLPKGFPGRRRSNRIQKNILLKYRSEIEAAGQVFQYLELATLDSKSALGWKPTKRLLDLIAKSDAGPSKTLPRSVTSKCCWT